MKRRLICLTTALLLLLSLLLSACGAGKEETHQPILPAPDANSTQTAPSSESGAAAASLEDRFVSAMLRFEDTVHFDNTTVDEGLDAFYAMLADHPELFWLTGGCSYVSMDDTVDFTVDLRMSLDQAKASQAVMENRIVSVLSGITAGMSDFEKALYLHDQLVESTEYDTDCYEQTLKDPKYKSNAQTAYGCLTEHMAVCAGYTAAYQLLLQRVGIPCSQVEGVAGGDSHAWNLITLDGEPYYVDVTWDDPIVSDAADAYTTHEFFCITTEELLLTHTIDADQDVPICRATKYDYYRWYDQYMETYDRDKFTARIQNAQQELAVKFGSEAALQQAVRDLADSNVLGQLDSSLLSVRYWQGQGGRALFVSIQRDG